MAAGDLTTIANVEAWLKLTAGCPDEALLTRLLSAASTYAQSVCNRQFASQAYTEQRDGNGGRRMVFANSPVTAVASVTIDGVAIPAGDAVLTAGYFFTPTKLMLNGYCFGRGYGNVLLSYTAGYATTPLDLEQAVIEMVAHAYRERDRTGLSSQANAGETTAYIIRDLPPRAATILAQYTKVVQL